MHSAQSQHVAGVFLAKHAEKNVAQLMYAEMVRGELTSNTHSWASVSLSASVCVCLCVQWWRDQLWVEQLIPALPLCEDNPHSSISWWMVKKKGFSLAHIWFSFMTARHWNTFMWMLCVRYTYLISLQQWGPVRAQCSQWVLFDGKNRLTNLTEKKWQFN